jgi:hypothetical protein
MMTIADIVDFKMPAGAAEDSMSMLKVWQGGGERENSPRDTLILHSGDGTFIVRRGNWKLILGRGSGGFTKFKPAHDAPPGQLYRLDVDLGEKHNLYNERPGVVRDLMSELERVKAGKEPE